MPVRVLWILPYLPWPATSGGKTRQYQLLKNLARQGYKITLLVQSKHPADEACRRELESFLEALIVLPRRPLRHPLTLLAALFGRWPLLASINGLAPKLEAEFSRLLTQEWDIVQVEHSYSFQPYARRLKAGRQPFILTEHNLESSLGGATYNRFSRWMYPFVVWDQWRARRWEQDVFAAAARVVAVTEEDAAAIRVLTQTPVDVVVNGVDCAAFSDVSPAPEQKRLLFLGNYEYPPNIDAVTWLLDEIMPLLWQKNPDAKCTIAGYAMPRGWAARWPDRRIEWVGFVEDLAGLQRTCSVFVAPLREGGGSKLKVLEAMAGGLPLVTTRQGASGLQIHNGQEYLHADDAGEFARATDYLLEHPVQAASLAARARRYVRDKHDWQVAAEQLAGVYERTMETRV